MTSYQRREQLINVGRGLFATQGYEAVSVEEIAAAAKVSKPIVYEHFGGKEGLYAVIVDREMQKLTSTLIGALSAVDSHPRQIVERTALALLTYIEENSEGFNVLVRDSPTTDPAGSFSSLLGDVSLRVEEILTKSFKQHKLPAKGVPYYAQMLVGMTVFTGQYWAANQKKISKEQLAAHIVNLAWHGLSRLEARPKLRYENTDTNGLTDAKSGVNARNDARNDAGNGTGNNTGNDATGNYVADTNEADNAYGGHMTEASKVTDTNNVDEFNNRKDNVKTDRHNGNDAR
jgi:AcrR family transcriptional regulator